MPDDPGLANDDDSPIWPEIDLEPTNLIALWPGVEPPTLTEVVAGLETICGPISVDALDVDDLEVPWAAGLKLTEAEVALTVWSEPAKPLPAEEVERIDGEACKWVVGVEAILGDDPLADFVELVRLVRDGLEASPAVLDVNTTTWYTRRDLHEVFGYDAIEPPADVLWTIHAVMPDPETGHGNATWLHTHGLWRCGCLELEMIEVPRTCVAEAAELINTVGELLLESGTPGPGEAMAVGDQLSITLQPWQKIVPFIGPETPGGNHDRDDEAHQSIRAVVCASEPQGAYRKLWAWPDNVIEKMRQGDTVMYRTVRATERQSRMAQGRWDQLATAFASWRQHGAPARVMFLVKAGFCEADEAARREHLWFRIESFQGDAAAGVLLNDPLHIRSIKRDDHVTIDREIVSDWHVLCPAGAYGPGEVDAMWRALDSLAGG